LWEAIGWQRASVVIAVTSPTETTMTQWLILMAA
jgi:hypothetical protein